MTESSPERFDGVRVMREIRDRISAEIADMSHDELVAWLRGHAYVDPLLRRLAEEIARQGEAAGRNPFPNRVPPPAGSDHDG